MLEYRNELKFVCTEYDLEILKHRLQCLMKYDKHQNGKSYKIRSLYFDDYYRTAFAENEAGVDLRKKFRIRIYDDLRELIRLEIKYKIRGKTKKESCLISTDMCNALINGEKILFDKNYPEPLKLLYIEMKTKNLKPSIIIEYERTAFTYKLGNVRITLDKNISYSNDINKFLDYRVNLTPIQRKGEHVLEVKYDEFLPDYIAQVLELGNLERTTFSKFYLGKSLSIGG